MQGNADMYHVLTSTEQKVHINMATIQNENSNSEKLLGK